MDLKKQVMAVLRESLHQHGWLPLPVKDQVLIGVADWRVSCTGVEHNAHSGAHIIGASLAVESPGWGLVLHEMATGVGATVKEAIAEAVRAWQHGQFEVLRDAFGTPEAVPATHIVVRDAAGGQAATWAVYESDLQVVGPGESLIGPIRAQALVARLGAPLADQLDPTAPAIHWIKLYGGSVPRAGVHADAWFDNRDWPPGAAMLRGLRWPSDDDYHAVRQFLILRPVAGEAAPPESLHVERYAPPTAAMAQAVAALEAQPDLEDDAWAAALIAQGMASRLAYKLITFLPLVAARELVTSLDVIPASQFAVANSAGEWVELPLEGDPVYRAVRWWLAGSLANRTVSPDIYKELAVRSVEIAVINHALHNKVDIKGARMASVRVEGLTTEDFETGCS
jgi:hypothetical protein